MMADNNEKRDDLQQESVSSPEHMLADNNNKPHAEVSWKEKILNIATFAWDWLKAYLLVIKEWFTGKRGTKTDRWAMAVCLFLSISVWLFVMSSNDTGFEKQLAGVDINIEGGVALSAQNMSIINGHDNTATVTLKGARGDIGSLTSDDLHMFVDVSEISEPGRHVLKVMVDLPKNSTLVSINPSEIAVNVDVISSNTVDVKVGLDYSMDASYSISETIPSKESVLVTGPKSVLDTIKYAGVSFDVGRIDKSLTLVGTIQLFDEYNNPIANPYIKCNVSEITVLVRVTTTKTVPLSVKFVDSDCLVNKLTPSTVTLIGDPAVLGDMKEFIISIDSEDYNLPVSKLTEITINDLKLPDGVYVSEETDLPIKIEVTRFY